MQKNNANDRPERRREQLRVISAIDEIALGDAMFAAVSTSVQPYPSMSAALLDQVRDHCLAQARATLRTLHAGAPPGEDVLAYVRSHAALRAQQQLPLSALLHAYRVGYGVVWDHIRTEVTREPASIDTVFALADLCVDYVNAISFAASEGYLSGQRRILIEQERTHRSLLETLLRGDSPRDEAQVLLSALRLDARGSLFALIVAALPIADAGSPKSLEAALRGALDALLPTIASDDAPALVGVMHDRAVALVVRPEGSDLRGWTQAIADAVPKVIGELPLGAGLSTAWSTLSDVPRAYKEAARAVGLARTDNRFVPLASTTLLDDLVGLADETTYRLVPDWAPVLLEEDRRSGGELSTTLLAYLDEQLSVTRAATRLDVHPNTIRYRLHRIESITAAPLRSFTHLFEVVASLRLLERKP